MIDERMTSPNGLCHRCSRPVTGDRRLCGSCAVGIPRCTCEHGRALHDIKPRTGQRTACTYTTPDGPCPCTCFEEEQLP